MTMPYSKNRKIKGVPKSRNSLDGSFIYVKSPTFFENHGDRIIDDYEWLRSDKKAAEKHLKEEQTRTAQATKHLADLQNTVFHEIKHHIRETDVSPPVRKGKWWFYQRTVSGKSYPYYYRIQSIGDFPPKLDKTPSSNEELIFDANAESRSNDFFSIGTFCISNDGKYLLYGIDNDGSERYTLRVRNIETFEDLPDVIYNTAAGACFHPDGKSFFYCTTDEAWRPDKIWQHTLGSGVEHLVFHDSEYWLGFEVSKSEKVLFIGSGNSQTSAYWILDLESDSRSLREVWPRENDVLYTPEHAIINGKDILLIVHNRNAVNFELVAANFINPLQCVPIIPHNLERNITDIEAFEDYLTVSYRQDGLPKIAVAQLTHDMHSAKTVFDSNTERHKNTVQFIDNNGACEARHDVLTSLQALKWEEVKFDNCEGEVYSVFSESNEEWSSAYLQISLESFKLPKATYMYEVKSKRFTKIHSQIVIDYLPEKYVEKRLWAKSKDGTEIPISLVFRRDLVHYPAPCLLYGYGSYGVCIDPQFSTKRLPLLDRGVIYAVAHVRGGGEMGENWYRQAKYENKPLTFSDFIACAKTLIENNYTSSEKLAIEGRSAGGMLIGAVINSEPELFTAAIAGVPFVDVLTTMLMPNLPLTIHEYTEWGNPTDSEEAYKWIKSYSPYHNIANDASRYPSILAITGTKDPRVSFIEPTKWVCKLREKGANAILHVEDTCGHFGASGRYDIWKSQAWEIAWILDKVCQ